jgi:hypothetical protein
MKPRIRSQSKAASTWATRRFDCPVHREEAAAFFDAIQERFSVEIGDPDPDLTLNDLLSSVGHPLFARAASPSQRRTRRDVVQDALADFIYRKALLGPASDGCTWDVKTLGVRFVRAIIDQRVRHRGGCTCGSGTPSAG